jgi:hypothetical protein
MQRSGGRVPRALGKSGSSPYHSVQQKVFPLNGKYVDEHE